MPAARSKSAKKPSPLDLAKEELASKQQNIEELTNELRLLEQEYEKQKQEVERLKRKLYTILPEILSHRDREKFPLEPVDDLLDIDEEYIREMVYMLVDDLYLKRNKRSLVEQRLEDLETKVTEQSMKYQTIVMKNLACINGLEEALDAKTTQELQRVLKRLRQNLVLDRSVDLNGNASPVRKLPPRVITTSRSSHALDIIKEMRETPFPLTKPLRKQCGATHIRYLLPEIHKAVCNELSLEKYTGGDWRLFAQKVGVSTETIQFWRRLNMRNPMEQVLTYWKDSKGATVRMLYRHLKSPDINALLPAKLISDFYQVDDALHDISQQ